MEAFRRALLVQDAGRKDDLFALVLLDESHAVLVSAAPAGGRAAPTGDQRRGPSPRMNSAATTPRSQRLAASSW